MMDWTSLDAHRTQLPELEIAARLLLAILLGGVVGFEREMKDQAAGLRTHMLTAMAAAVFTIIAFEIFHTVRAIDASAGLDPIRVVEAVTAGVAFLAAGSIIQSGGTVRGLTTGAGMWMAGAVGVACGAGYFVFAGIAVALSVVILAVLKWVERRYIDAAPDHDRGGAG